MSEGMGEGAVVGGAIGLIVGAVEGLDVVVGLRVGSGEGRLGVAKDGRVEGTSDGEVVGGRVAGGKMAGIVTAERACNFLLSPSDFLRSAI